MTAILNLQHRVVLVIALAAVIPLFFMWYVHKAEAYHLLPIDGTYGYYANHAAQLGADIEKKYPKACSKTENDSYKPYACTYIDVMTRMEEEHKLTYRYGVRWSARYIAEKFAWYKYGLFCILMSIIMFNRLIRAQEKPAKLLRTTGIVFSIYMTSVFLCLFLDMVLHSLKYGFELSDILQSALLLISTILHFIPGSGYLYAAYASPAIPASFIVSMAIVAITPKSDQLRTPTAFS